MSVERALAVIGPLLASTEALAAVGAGLRRRIEPGPIEPALAASLDGVLDALDVRDLLDALGDDDVASLLALVEGSLAQAADLVGRPRPGWDHADRGILLAQGNTSALLAGVFHRSVVPALGADLAAQLEAGGSFLDVGVGVGALAIAMCRRWPELTAVGVDPWRPALELAREHVAAAGLGDRIELRQVTAQELADAGVHDLAWVPTFFVSAAVLPLALARVHAALRPGGGAILGLYTRPDDPLTAAVADLRTVRQGGARVTAPELATLMADAGFAGVETLADPDGRAPLVFVVGRRPDAA